MTNGNSSNNTNHNRTSYACWPAQPYTNHYHNIVRASHGHASQYVFYFIYYFFLTNGFHFFLAFVFTRPCRFQCVFNEALPFSTPLHCFQPITTIFNKAPPLSTRPRHFQ